jgi:hypothetical protein
MKPFRCSSLGLIMTDAKSIDDRLLTPEIAEISRKTKKTDDEKQMIQGLLERSLSAGAKTEIKSMAKEHVYDFKEVITGKYMDKGLIVEDQAIELYNSVFFTNYKKNTVRLTNEWITGECDIIIPKVRGIDIKSSWSLATFPAVAEDGEDKLYEWQCRGYMMLHEVPEWEVAYCMVNTPDELIKYEQESLHFVDHIPEELRITRVQYKRDMALEEKIKRKVEAARAYLTRIVEQIQEQHHATEIA